MDIYHMIGTTLHPKRLQIVYYSILFCFMYSFVSAQSTIYVDDDNVLGPWNGTEDYPYKLIQQGINAASPTGGQTILVYPGTYRESINFNGKLISVMSRKGAEKTVIDGTGSVVRFDSGENFETVLDGFTIKNGTGTYYSFQVVGGGIFCLDSSPTIRNSVLTENKAEYGGGMWCEGGSPIISENMFTNNLADEYGGGLYIRYSSSRILSNQFISNISDDDGGAICCSEFTNPLIMNNIVKENDANGGGGGIRCDGSFPVIKNSLFSNNNANNSGGAIECRTSGPEITNCVIVNNKTNGIGGGIHCTYTEALIKNCIVNNNKSYSGGGLSFSTFCSKLKSTTISGNKAEKRGGGIFFWQSVILLEATNSILTNNNASEGIEIYMGSSSHPSNMVIDYSVLQGGQGKVYFEPGCSFSYGQNMIEEDPLLTAGPHGLCYLSNIDAGQAKDSPCLNAGSDDAYNLGMNEYWTRTDGVYDTGLVDMGAHVGPFSSIFIPSLYPDAHTISQSAGNHIILNIAGGKDNANRNYLMLGSITGSEPGFPLPGGIETLPLNLDGFTDQMIMLINTPIFRNFYGKLNGIEGSAKAMLYPGIIRPEFIGTQMNFAYCLNNPFDCVSNSILIEIVP